MTPEDLLNEWGAGWVTKDETARRRHFEACAAPDVEFLPPDDRPAFRGREALIAHVAEYTAPWPEGTGAVIDGPVQTHHGWSRALIRWKFPHADAVGCEIMRVAGGRIATMVVFADAYVETQK
jgi:ketosteroid isomerase-like protein